VNIRFSDRFSEGLAQLGNVADWAALDAGKVANNQLFWEGVQESFKNQDEIYDNLHIVDDEVLSELHHINFQKIVPHDLKKHHVNWTLHIRPQ